MDEAQQEQLTETQRAARERLKQQVADLISKADEKALFRARPTTKELGAGRDACDPAIIYDPEAAPPGPPWHYDVTPDEAAEKMQKKEKRAEKRQKVKETALGKAPKKLKNPSSLQVRFRTGLVYTLLTIACVFAGNIPTMVYLMVVAGICAGEFYYMLRSDAKLPNEALGIGGAVLFIPATYFFGLAGALVVAIVLLIALLVWYVFWLRARIQDVAISFFGAAYTGLLLCGLMIIRQSVEPPWGGLVMFMIFLSVWANDAFAYFVGSKIGKHKLAPRVSPKKSWEGFLAGLVGSMLVWLVMSFIPGLSLPVPLALVFGFICGLMEVLGDLAESRIKRNSGFKDSGTIMPGHGGLLDRTDSLFLASVTAAFLMIAGGVIPYVI
ncbi:phosphatidate cytidylyltransferase [Adlercreutzia murintestinalis]|uniref:phosphatidate cytidylyltransferase n=1 Tax=Adlercreutzia murintestinalis TaxID=2941325 RepID=UPI00203E70E9|nr:phosphatidate cytidylyltransferase [Adlercreutzia murintestinalis]